MIPSKNIYSTILYVEEREKYLKDVKTFLKSEEQEQSQEKDNICSNNKSSIDRQVSVLKKKGTRSQ